MNTLTVTASEIMTAAQPGSSILSILFVILFITFVAACVLIFWKIFNKTGLPGYFALGMLIPGLNIVLIVILALIKWPIEKELAEYKKKYGPLKKTDQAEFDDLPVCVKCQTPLPPGAKNCIACGWPDKYKDIV